MPRSPIMERAFSLMQQRGIKQAEFARRLDVSPQTMSAWFTGRSNPKTLTIVKMCQFLGCSPSWLMTGREDDPGHQTIVNADSIQIPLVSAQASCGNGIDNSTTSFVSLIEVNRQWVDRYCGAVNVHALNIIAIYGDSMKPTLCDGDFAIIDTSINRLFSDGLYAFTIDGDLFVKRFQRTTTGWTIRSDNTLYPPTDLSPDDLSKNIFIVGRVVTTCTIEHI